MLYLLLFMWISHVKMRKMKAEKTVMRTQTAFSGWKSATNQHVFQYNLQSCIVLLSHFMDDG